MRMALEDFVEAYLTPTDKGCRWCLAAPKCPAMRQKANAVARRVFSNELPYDPAELAATLDQLPILEAWIKNVREFAYAEAEKGHDIPNYKLVDKRPTRKWRNEDDAEDFLAEFNIDIYEPRKLISPATAEKLLPKEDRDELAGHIIKESSGHALVHESDKRPAVRTDARSAFS